MYSCTLVQYEYIQENAMVFSYMAFVTSKAFKSDPIVLISIFIVFHFRADRLLYVCVMCVVFTFT